LILISFLKFIDKQMKAVYDLTIGYPDLLPQSEMDALRGVFPKNVHFHIKRQVVTSIYLFIYFLRL